MSSVTRYIGTAVGVAVVAFLCWLMFHVEHTPTEPQRVEIDTIFTVKRDTVHIEKDIVKHVFHYDTVVVNDTVYIRDVPQEYIDSADGYRLRINAVKLYDYALDIYKVDTFTRYIEKKPAETKKRAKFGNSLVVGLQVGYGLGVQPSTMQARFEPYIGVGVSYGFGITF